MGPEARVEPIASGTELHRTMTLASDAVPTLSGGGARGRRVAGGLPGPSRLLSHSGLGINGPANGPASVLGPESDTEDDFESRPPMSPQSVYTAHAQPDDATSCVQGTLPREFFTERDLVGHLRQLDSANTATAIALDDLWHQRMELDPTNVINSFESSEAEPNCHANATYEVYEIRSDGVAAGRHDMRDDLDGDILGAATVWETIKEVNPGGDAVGRMTLLQEPTPAMLAATHMTMEKHFDMDELFEHLISKGGDTHKTRAYMNRAFEEDELHRRTFFFVFKYYTVLGEGLTPAPWQQYDHRPPDHRSPDHINIAECSSVLALSLQGPPRKSVGDRSRRTKRKKGYVYDPFAPWHLISIQCFPDYEHTMRGEEDDGKRFINGPYAFLDTLVMEYKDAVKRYTKLNEMITTLITPPSEFMFNVKLRDELLFEDQHFTYSRRYFWAYNTLGVINDGIKSMTSAYDDTFDEKFWAGSHQTLWPHPDPASPEGRSYEAKMSSLRQDLERAVGDLGAMHAKNERTQFEISSLREQLFSGSSVKESRRAIEQGDNIKILTGVSMVFLPLTFVTSVFGITEFRIPASDWRFAVTMVCVCVPFFVLILVLQTRRGMNILKKCGNFLGRHFGRHLRPGRARQQGPSSVRKAPRMVRSADFGNHAAAADPERREKSSWGFLYRRELHLPDDPEAG